jgi:hypothetical protein
MSETGRGREVFGFVVLCALLSVSRNVWVWALDGWKERLKRLCGKLCECREVGLDGGEVELFEAFESFELSGDLERLRKDGLRERNGGM